MTVSLPAVAKWLCAFLLAQWLALAEPSRRALTVLVYLMAIDYATGLISAYVNRDLSSRTGVDGLLRKGMTILLILTCHIAELGTGIELHLEMAGAIGFAINEFISIVENCAKTGVWVPGQVVEVLLAIKKIKAKGATAEQLRALNDDALSVTRAEVDSLRSETRDAADTNLADARAEADTSRRNDRKEADASSEGN